MDIKNKTTDAVANRLLQASRSQFDTLASLRTAQKKSASIEAKLADTEAKLGAVLSSTSWRVTSPVRWTLGQLSHLRIRSPEKSRTFSSKADTTLDTALDYEQWIAHSEPRLIECMLSTHPGFEPVMCPTLGIVRLGDGQVDTTIGHVVAGEIVDACSPVFTNAAEPEIVRFGLKTIETDFICLVDRNCEIIPSALKLVASRLARQPDLDVLFADEDVKLPGGNRVQPFFKPDWDVQLQRGRNLAGPLVVVRCVVLRGIDFVAGPAWLYDLVNRVVATVRPERVGHIPAVLTHRLQLPTGYVGAMANAAQAELRRAGITGHAEPIADRPGWQRVVYELPTPQPLVSIIVPTRDHSDLLQACIEGVLERTDYPHLQLLIVDNGTVEQKALALLNHVAQDARVTVLRDARPFNWPALNNKAARHATGEVLILLNNDIVVLRPDWLTELVSHAIQPSTGAVGAKLLYPDGRIQHAGLTMDTAGYPFHLLRHADGDSSGSWDLLGLARNVWGVTGACMAVRRTVFFEVGGLNEALPVACNDVDFCLRVTTHGYDIVWTPWSVLEHPELGTRKPDTDPSRQKLAAEEMSRLWRDWGVLLWHDPYLNPNLERDGDQLSLRKPGLFGP